MSDHTQNIFKAFKDLEFKDTVSHQCGVTLNDSVEARAIAELMSTKPGIFSATPWNGAETLHYFQKKLIDKVKTQRNLYRMAFRLPQIGFFGVGGVVQFGTIH